MIGGNGRAAAIPTASESVGPPELFVCPKAWPCLTWLLSAARWSRQRNSIHQGVGSNGRAAAIPTASESVGPPELFRVPQGLAMPHVAAERSQMEPPAQLHPPGAGKV